MQGVCQIGGRSRIRRKGGSEAKHITRATTTGDYAKKPIFAFVVLGLSLFLATPPSMPATPGPGLSLFMAVSGATTGGTR